MHCILHNRDYVHNRMLSLAQDARSTPSTPVTSPDPTAAAAEALSKIDPGVLNALVALLDGKTPGDGPGAASVPPVEPEAPTTPASSGKKNVEDDTIVTPSDGKPVAWINQT